MLRRSARLAAKNQEGQEHEQVQDEGQGQQERFWFWKKDGHSFTEAFLSTYLQTVNPAHPTTPNGKDINYHFLKHTLSNFQSSKEFVLDKSRIAQHDICSISHEPFSSAEPYLLNLTGRSYALEALLNAIDTLRQGNPLRLEDVTLEPENLREIVLYPNLSLGASPAQAITFAHEQVPIAPFDFGQALQSNPQFWEDVLQRDMNGMWSMESAAEKHGFKLEHSDCVVVKNQRAQRIQVPWPHPKMNSGTVIFKNCLFEDCEVMIGCWCGPRFHGCRFVSCTFTFLSEVTSGRAKRCDIVEGKLGSNQAGWSKAQREQWLRENLGQAFCSLQSP